MKGDIADGMLARFSMLGADSAAAVGVLERFIPVLVRAVAAGNQPGCLDRQPKKRAAALATTRNLRQRLICLSTMGARYNNLPRQYRGVRWRN